GVTYQLVTDHTSMVLLDDSVFANRGIARNNQPRVAMERQAQQVRAQNPAQVSRVDQNQPMFKGNAPHVSQRAPSGNGGGAIEPNVANALLLLLLVGAALYARKHLRSR
ncbi:MAG TPA: hypothetical protein PLN52_22040, partial [Opitutaceae bacterium]|nr:hypothetical protein [Opitutaceae bacterium]